MKKNSDFTYGSKTIRLREIRATYSSGKSIKQHKIKENWFLAKETKGFLSWEPDEFSLTYQGDSCTGKQQS